MVAAATAVSSAILGTVSLVPGGGGDGDGQSVYMASAGNVLQGISDGEPLPFVPPQPYGPEGPRQVAGLEALLAPAAGPAGLDLPNPLLTTPGSRSIPPRVLAAYQAAERIMRAERPSCRMSWPLLAGIGRIESGHARNGDVDAKGTTLNPILGPALTGEGNFALIRDSDGGTFDTDTVYDRAVGPMQFLPGTWKGLGRDGNGDGKADPNNIADAALASAGYLCLGGGNMLDRKDLLAAVFRYNRSWEYVSHVLAWAGVYAKSGKLGKQAGLQPGKPGKARKPGKPAPVPSTPPVPTPAPVVTVPVPTPVVTLPPAVTPTPLPTVTPTPTPADPAPSILSVVAGRVFLDDDADTVDDLEDRGVAEATVRVHGTSAAGAVVDLTVPTDAQGRFSLNDLAPGTYAVTLSALPAGLFPRGALTSAGWLPDVVSLAPVTVGPGATLHVGFIAQRGR